MHTGEGCCTLVLNVLYLSVGDPGAWHHGHLYCTVPVCRRPWSQASWTPVLYLSVGDPGAWHHGHLAGLLPHQLELDQGEYVRVGETQQHGHGQTLQV